MRNNMEISRDYYLNKLISRKGNGMIKVITGVRRCGKSYLLNTLFCRHLLASGVPEEHKEDRAVGEGESRPAY